MGVLNAITWDFSPFLIETEFLTVRWYTFFFITSFLIAYFKFSFHLKKEGIQGYWAELTLLIMATCIILFARLGHVFFYNWNYYQNHIPEIIQLKMGGLSSHGGVIGLFIAAFIVSKVIKRKSFLWVLDVLAVPLLLGGSLIRFGNLFNQEIVGITTNSTFGIIFPLVDSIPRYPIQLVEGITYFIIVLTCYFFERRNALISKEGFMIGLVLIATLIPRFFIEFLKAPLSENWIEAYISMGQLLSLPLILIGFYLLKKAK